MSRLFLLTDQIKKSLYGHRTAADAAVSDRFSAVYKQPTAWNSKRTNEHSMRAR